MWYDWLAWKKCPRGARSCWQMWCICCGMWREEEEKLSKVSTECTETYSTLWYQRVTGNTRRGKLCAKELQKKSQLLYFVVRTCYSIASCIGHSFMLRANLALISSWSSAVLYYMLAELLGLWVLSCFCSLIHISHRTWSESIENQWG